MQQLGAAVLGVGGRLLLVLLGSAACAIVWLLLAAAPARADGPLPEVPVEPDALTGVIDPALDGATGAVEQASAPVGEVAPQVAEPARRATTVVRDAGTATATGGAVAGAGVLTTEVEERATRPVVEYLAEVAQHAGAAAPGPADTDQPARAPAPRGGAQPAGDAARPGGPGPGREPGRVGAERREPPALRGDQLETGRFEAGRFEAGRFEALSQPVAAPPSAAPEDHVAAQPTSATGVPVPDPTRERSRCLAAGSAVTAASAPAGVPDACLPPGTAADPATRGGLVAPSCSMRSGSSTQAPGSRPD